MPTKLQTALEYLDSIEKIDRMAFDELVEIAVPILEREYLAEINESLDYAKVKANLVWDTDEDGEAVASCYLGTVFDLFPSGKFYAVYARSNASDIDVLLDSAFGNALLAWSILHGGYSAHGEDDPCDIFFWTYQND
jgi:hypothetical protein